MRIIELNEPWRRDALCKEYSPKLFFPDEHQAMEGLSAKAICKRCLVQVECLEYALTFKKLSGTWGGTSEKQRIGIQARRRVAP